MHGVLLNNDQVRHDNILFSHTNFGGYAYISTRKTALESSTGAFSVSGWFIPSMSGLYVHRVVGVRQTGSSLFQWGINFNNPGGTVSGASGHLRFLLHTNSTNFMYVDSDAIVPRNRPIFFIVSWDGVNNAGMDMYLQGVKQTGTRAMTGTYSTPYSHVDLRFMIGRETSDSLKGNLRDLAMWDKKLSDAEALEAWNGGRVKDVNTLSYYADILGYWPLKTDTTCLNDSSLNMDVSNAITSEKKTFSTQTRRISFKKATVGNTRYVSFGSLVKVSSTLAYWIGRSGTSHLVNGKIVKIAIHLDTGVIDAPVDIITDGTYDLRGGNAAIINGSIYVFSSRYSNPNFIDLGYYVSTDGLTGEAYGSRQTLTTVESAFNAYGEIVAGFAAGEYFVPSNESNQVNSYRIILYKTTDNGANFSRVEAYAGSTKLAEPSLINLGSNTLMILARRNDSPYGIFRIVSTDGGATWDTPTLTNLAGTLGASNCSMSLTESGKLTVFLMDRSGDSIMVSRSNTVATILASAVGFNAADYRAGNSYGTDSLNILGYPTVITPVNSQWVAAYSAESSSSVADLFIGTGELN